jgi:hypothetical protein
MLTRIALCLLLSTAPLAAQEAEDGPAEGLDLMQEGAEMLLRGLIDEIQPPLDDMAAALAALEPRLRELLVLVDDLANYEAPERLENGDILIRRKTGPDIPPPPPLPEPEPETEPAPEMDL